MVVDGATGKVLGDIPNTPGVHGAGIATKAGHGFTTNGGDSDRHDVRPEDARRDQADQGRAGRPRRHHVRRARRQDHPDESQPPDRHADRDRSEDRRHRRAPSNSRTPRPKAPRPTARDTSSSTTKSKNTIQVIDVKTWKATASWPLAPCEGPTGIAYDKATNRIFSGCSKTSVVVDATTGKVVATIANGTRVDALGWDPGEEADLHPERRRGQRHRRPPGLGRQVHVVATVPTFARREDDLRRSEDAQRLSVPAGARSGAAAARRRAAAGARPARTRAAGSDHRVVVHQDHALSRSRSDSPIAGRHPAIGGRCRSAARTRRSRPAANLRMSASIVPPCASTIDRPPTSRAGRRAPGLPPAGRPPRCGIAGTSRAPDIPFSGSGFSARHDVRNALGVFPFAGILACTNSGGACGRTGPAHPRNVEVHRDRTGNLSSKPVSFVVASGRRSG